MFIAKDGVRERCRSHMHGTHWCRDGFPQSATCAGIDGGVPQCLQEDGWYAKLIESNGGKPDLVKIVRLRSGEVR